MAWNIDKLRETGDPADATLADMLQFRLEARGEFPLPTTKQPAQTTSLELVKPQYDIDSMARLAIADSAEDYLYEQPKDVIHELQQTSELNMQVQLIFMPILQALKEKLFETSTQSKRRFSKKNPKKSNISWTYKSDYWDYHSWLHYTTENKEMVPTSFVMQLDKAGLSSTLGSYRLSFELKDNLLTEVHFENRDGTHDEIEIRKHFAKHAPVELELHKWNRDLFDGMVPPGNKARVVHSIFLAQDGINYTSRSFKWIASEIGSSYGQEVLHELIERKYDSESHTLKTSIKGPERKSVFGDDMDPSVLLTVAKALAGLVPTRTLEL